MDRPDKHPKPESGKRRRFRLRSLLWRLSTWEKVLLSVFCVLFLILSARTAVNLWAKNRAARLHARIEQLRGSTDVEDWRELHDLTGFWSDLFHPSWRMRELLRRCGVRVWEYENVVRDEALEALNGVIFKGASSMLKAVTSGDERLRVLALRKKRYITLRDHPMPPWPERIRMLAEALLDDNVEVRAFVLSKGHRYRSSEEQILRFEIIEKVIRLNETRAVALVGEYLEAGHSAKFMVGMKPRLISLLAWYTESVSEERWPEVEPIVLKWFAQYSAEYALGWTYPRPPGPRSVAVPEIPDTFDGSRPDQ